MRTATLAMTERQHKALQKYIFPGDGLEAAGVLLCNQGTGKSHQRLIVSDVLYLPHNLSERKKDSVIWPFGIHLTPERITNIDLRGQSIVTIHSHPNGCNQFSEIDNRNDWELFNSIHCWFDDERLHGSAIMTPDGQIIARTVSRHGKFSDMKTVSTVGDAIRIWKTPGGNGEEAHQKKLRQTFGQGTLRLLRALRVGVVGCSGTGSIIIELLVRNCVGEVVVVDNDVVEEKNLNRIINGTMDDAQKRRPKVLAVEQAIQRIGIGTQVEVCKGLTDSPETVTALVNCDVIFGCVDSAFGRYHLDCLASAYLIPYFDVGVRLETDGAGGISAADAVSHYIHPEGDSLLSRGAYTMEQVTAENWKRKEPVYYQEQRLAGYLAAVGEEQPAVMSINMQAACMAFNDFIARIHSYRYDSDREFSVQRFRLIHGCYENETDSGSPHPLLKRYVGMGDRSLLVRNNISNG